MNTEYSKLERLKFSKGQRLYASDMQSIEQVNCEMRWFHNRSLHQPGIGSGFAVSGEIGDREVRIEPGYAIDSEGREIVLTRTKTLPVPPVAGGENNIAAFYDLIISYPEGQDLEEVETRQGVCTDRGNVRLREEPNFCWVKLDPNSLEPVGDRGDEIQKGLRITIMRAEIQNCRLNKKISIAQRRNARPAKGPNIVSGSYVPKPEEWKLWQNQEADPLGLKISIDTSNANFITPPNYQAEIIGERYVSGDTGSGIYPYLLEGFLNPFIPSSSGKPITSGFDLFILMPTMNLGYAGGYDLMLNPGFFFTDDYIDYRQQTLRRLGWQITWIGTEG